MPDVAIYNVRPPVRCFGRSKEGEGAICGKPAEWQRSSRDGELVAFFCHECHEPGDQPLRGDTLFRRVAVFAEILFCGASSDRTLAHAEVLYRIEKAVRSAGGVLNIHGVSSTLGRKPLEAPRRAVVARRVGV